ncbi:hypothetical protein Ami103574_10845 [Aminipila butyrica]|uniref:Uncharacterized protein n=1 Tax=Aminipila butyrica TaxID=433296 RepID=A0A858C089_9FIRM|nr:hypothetical protein [Aminipila butyrica]QIB69786.1 hypothetical protein Ami103574_10845 [Aminipila butyrica]
MNIGEVVKSIFTFLFEDATNTLVKPLLNLVQIVALSPETLMNMPFLDPLFAVVQKIGAAILILVVSWQGLKSMLVSLGFEAEEPQKIAAKTFVAGFLLYYIKDILIKMITISSGFIELIMASSNTAIGGDGLAEIVLKMLMGSATSSVYMILGLVLFFKLIGLMYKMFKRLAMCAALIICSPMAVATMVAKPTEGFMQGFIKLFVGNIVIQIIQALCIVACLSSLQVGFGGNILPGNDDVFSVMLTIAFMGIMGQLEDIVRDLSMSVGLNRDMQGAFGKLQSAAYTASMFQGASRFTKVAG